MKPNVRIVVRERGKIAAIREGHNTWTQHGSQYLSQLISLSSMDPDVGETAARIKYIGFGIGGVGQRQLSMVQSAPWSTVFAPGLDPETTTGNQYNSAQPFSPLVSTLERPVPITAVTGPTPAYPATLNWRTLAFDAAETRQPIGHPDVVVGGVQQSDYLYTTSYFAQFQQGVNGSYYYIHEPYVTGGFVQMPLSEAGLFLNTASLTTAYEPVVAYITFDTVQITRDTDLSIEWDVRF